MDDLLVLGSDRQRSPWPRRLAAVAVLIAAAVVVITHLPGKREAPSRHPAVSVSVSAGPVQLAGLGSGAAGLLDQADGITGPARSATFPSPAGRSPGPQHHSAGRHNMSRCPYHPVMRAGDGASPDATGGYCGAGTLQ
jgi:hypothetical protein